MRQLILQEFVSLDGLAAGPNDSVDYIPASTQGDQSFGNRQLEFMDSIDTILLGRVTYEMFVEYWPNITSGEDKVFADKLNAIPKLVFSRSLDRVSWGTWDNATVVRENAAKAVEKLKQQRGKDMVIWGSISLSQSLIDAALIDQYQLIVCPIVLGEGKPLFRNRAEPMGMRLLNTRSFDRGTVLLAYAAENAASADASR